MTYLFAQWLGLEWKQLLVEILANAVVFLITVIVGWYVLVRRKARFLQGDSDEIIFQSHHLIPVAESDGEVVLLFRNVGPRSTVYQLYDNPGAQDLLTGLAADTTLANPILSTEGRLGFEVLNDAFGYLAGYMSVAAFPRETWLFVMTCEDREVVRKECIRCFLIRPVDLQKFSDWSWCRHKVRVEKPSHWYRVVALHRIAQAWQQEKYLTQKRIKEGADVSGDMPLVDQQLRHNRIREMRIGICTDEAPVGEPYQIPWEKHLAELERRGLKLPAA